MVAEKKNIFLSGEDIFPRDEDIFLRREDIVAAKRTSSQTGKRSSRGKRTFSLAEKVGSRKG